MVCILLFSFSTRGGTGQYPAHLANGLSAHANVHLICPDATAMSSYINEGVTLHAYQTKLEPGVSWISGGIRGLLELRRLSAGIEPDIIHFPFLSPLRSVTLLPVLKTLNIPMVGTIHDPISHSGMKIAGINVDLRGKINVVASRLLDAIIVHGEECRNQANDAGYPMDRVHIVPHGLFDHFLNYDYEEHMTEPNTLLFFGNIRPNKGYDRIPSILDKVQEEIPDVTAIVAGNPSNARFIDQQSIEEITQVLREDEHIEFHNRFIPDEEVGELFSRATAVVMPYYDATSSGVAMTAYAFGTPMVATDVGDLGRMLSEDGTGLVADPESDQAIADSIATVLSDQDQRKRLKRNIERSRNQYRWERIGSQTVEIYQSILSTSQS